MAWVDGAPQVHMGKTGNLGWSRGQVAGLDAPDCHCCPCLSCFHGEEGLSTMGKLPWSLAVGNVE
eukprot:12882879-Prorocentrum_lima.AAC.1